MRHGGGYLHVSWVAAVEATRLRDRRGTPAVSCGSAWAAARTLQATIITRVRKIEISDVQHQPDAPQSRPQRKRRDARPAQPRLHRRTRHQTRRTRRKVLHDDSSRLRAIVSQLGWVTSAHRQSWLVSRGRVVYGRSDNCWSGRRDNCWLGDFDWLVLVGEK